MMDTHSEETSISDLYEYETIDDPKSIRLLKLAPGDADQPIACTLHIVPLESGPSYEAISYTWGDTAAREDLVCDNRLLSVTRNLADALRRIRLMESVRTVWADAVCIDQNNIDERGQQVSMMRRIYGRASRVLIWLGAGSEDSDLAFEFFYRLASLQCKIMTATELEECPEEELHRLQDESLSFDEYPEVFAEVDPTQRLSIVNFFRRSWF